MRWTLGSAIATNLLRVITIPILGRLLSPAEFGAVSAALTVIVLGEMLRDIGIGQAVVQRKTLSREQAEAAAGFTLGIGMALGLMTYAAAPAAAWFYDSAPLVDLVRALGAMFVLRALGSVSRALCQRALRFRALAVIDWVSYALGSATSVVLAATGMSVWSLVVGYLVETGIATAAVFVVSPVRIRFALAPLRDLLGFGTGSMLADVAVYFANNGDYLVVGHTLGKEPLGLYTRAYDLMRFPSAVFTNVAGYVLFSAFARLQDDRERLGRAFRRGMFLTAALLLPASAGFIVVAPELIHLLLGDQWGSAVLPFQVLAVSMMARTSWKIGGTLARAAGDVYAVAVANVLYGVLIVIGASIGAYWGIVGVSVAVSCECTIHYLVYTYLGLRRTTLRWRDVVVVHFETMLAALLVLVAVWATAKIVRSAAVSDAVVVATCGIAGLGALVLAGAAGVARRQADWVELWTGVRDRWFKRSTRARPTPG